MPGETAVSANYIHGNLLVAIETAIDDRGDFAMEFFDKFSATMKARGGPPPLGLHTLMQSRTAAKVNNMVKNMANNHIAPVEIVAVKSSVGELK